MTEDTELAELLLRIETVRERTEAARRLARGTTDRAAQLSLLAYADELEKDAEKLEAQAAVLKQAANEQAQEAEPVAALKPPPDPEPET